MKSTWSSTEVFALVGELVDLRHRHGHLAGELGRFSFLSSSRNSTMMVVSLRNGSSSWRWGGRRTRARRCAAPARRDRGLEVALLQGGSLRRQSSSCGHPVTPTGMRPPVGDGKSLLMRQKHRKYLFSEHSGKWHPAASSINH